MSDKTMPYFLDCEFIEDGQTIDLLSIGVCCGDGRELYLEVDAAEINWDKANPWVRANVRPHLIGRHEVVRSKAEIARELRAFVDLDVPEFWSWCGAYDWVAICQLYGAMIDKPARWPNYCRDLQQEMDRLGVTDEQLPPIVGDAHNALADARWHRHIWLYLTALERDLG
jgi:hypothetical protein